MSSGKGWLMRSTFLPKARILNMLDVLFFVETPKNIWQEGCSFGRPNLSRWVQSTVLGWTHRMYHGVPSLRSKEIRSTAWSRKCCWRTDLFEIWISCIWPLVSLQGKSWGDVCNVGFVREKKYVPFHHGNLCNLQVFSSGRYNLKWKLLNEMDLFFVVVYQGILQMAYLEARFVWVFRTFIQDK